MMDTRRTVGLAGGTAVLAALVGGGVWWALEPAGAQTTGSCDSASFFELTVEPDDGVLEVEFDLTSNAPGEAWTVVLERDGTVIHESKRTTDADAELEIDVVQSPDGDDDTFVVSATREDANPCVVTLTRD